MSNSSTPHDGGSRDGGSAPKPPAEGSLDGGSAPKPPAEGSLDGGSAPKPPAEGSLDAGSAPKPPAEGSLDAGSAPKPLAEGSPQPPPAEGGSAAEAKRDDGSPEERNGAVADAPVAPVGHDSPHPPEAQTSAPSPEQAPTAAEPPAKGPGEVRLRLFGRTDVGQVREHNEDNFIVADLTKESRGLMESDRVQLVGARGTLLGVCDGMGGAAAGEVASQLAVDIIYQRMAIGDPPGDHDELAARLVHAIEAAGLRIFSEAKLDRTRRGMGTTATIAALVDDHLFLGQVGDSRGYLLRGDRLVQVTRDQSLVNQLIEAGQLTEEEAETFEHNNIILQALGTSDTVQVDLTYAELRRGDMMLLCSDGLSGMVRFDEIRDIMRSSQEPLDICKALTERANQAGGHDNITVIIVVFDGAGLPPLTAETDALKYRKYNLPADV